MCQPHLYPFHMPIPEAITTTDTTNETRGIEVGGIPTADNIATASGNELSRFANNGISRNSPPTPQSTCNINIITERDKTVTAIT